MKDLSALTAELSKIGIVEVIKDDYVFTLFLTKGNDSNKLDLGMVPFTVLETCTKYVVDKPTIEVFKNNSNFILIVLKP